MQKNIKKLGYFLVSLFIVLIFYLTYLQVQQAQQLATDSRNRRVAAYEASMIRGSLLDRTGIKLAETKFTNGKGQRIYPDGPDFAQVIGYVSDRYGRSGLEAANDRYLLGLTDADQFRNLMDQVLGKPRQGDNVVLTLDAAMQIEAMNLLGNRRGAVVALNPRTGAILVCASSPSFDPNNLDSQWSQLQQDKAVPLLDRATLGAYPPGSTFKIITGSGILAQQVVTTQTTINCPGYLMVHGFKLNDETAHGTVNFNQALAESCNVYFAQEGLNLGKDKFWQTASKFGFGQDPGLGIPVRAATMTPLKDMDQNQLAVSAIGQGQVLVSPLFMAQAAAAIANNGVAMKPYLVQTVQSPSGQSLFYQQPKAWLTATSPAVAAQIKQAMVGVVQAGTGTAAAISGVQVAGKTGTAQNPQGNSHAWFVGFAPAENPVVAVAVIVENGGDGGTVAAPIAREVMSLALQQIKS